MVIACPCCSKRRLDECCGPVIAGRPAPSAEALVRARYTAFALRNLDYVEKTHAPEVREDFNRAEAERIAEECEWLGLHIQSIKECGDIVEIAFVISVRHEHKVTDKAVISRFRRECEEWFFISSKPAPHLAHRRGPKIGRNDLCYCDSGLKFKKCCANAVGIMQA